MAIMDVMIPIIIMYVMITIIIKNDITAVITMKIMVTIVLISRHLYLKGPFHDELSFNMLMALFC